MLHSSVRSIRCEYPVVLRGRPFNQVTQEEFCPLITQVSVNDIQPYSAVVSWESREHTELSGFEVFYQAVDGAVDDVSTFHTKLAPLLRLALLVRHVFSNLNVSTIALHSIDSIFRSAGPNDSAACK